MGASTNMADSSLEIDAEAVVVSIDGKSDAQIKGDEIRQTTIHALDDEILLRRQELGRIIQSDSKRLGMLDTLAKALMGRYKDQGKQRDLDEAIYLHREIVNSTPQSHPQLPNVLEVLGYLLNTRGNSVGLDDDFNEAITVRRQALTLHISNHLVRIRILSNLAVSLATRFKRAEKECDLNEAIALYKEAWNLQSESEDNNSKVSTLVELIPVLQTRFTIAGDICDLEECIPLFKKLTLLQKHPDPQEYLSSFLEYLAATLRARFMRSGTLYYLEKAIDMRRQALNIVPDPHPYHSTCLNGLATTLQTFFENTGKLSYIQEAIGLYRQELQLRPHTHPRHSTYLYKLGDLLQIQFEFCGGLNQLEEAIESQRQALRLIPNSEPRRHFYLKKLARPLQIRFKHGGESRHIDEAIELYMQALHLTPHRHPDRPSSLDMLAGGLHARFRHEGGLKHLDDAITLRREALQLVSDANPRFSHLLDNLAALLQSKFEHGGGLTDIDEAIDLHRHTLRIRPLPHPDHCDSLNNLAVALHAKFEYVGGLGLLNEALELQRQALQIRPESHPEYYTSVINLAGILRTQYTNGGGLNYLKESIEMHRRALQLTPHPHPNHITSLNNLANSLSDLYEHGREFSYLEEATEMYRQVLQNQSDLHPNRSQSLNNLATALQLTFKYRRSTMDLQEATELHKQALELRPKPHRDRFMSVNNLARVFQDQSNHRSAVHHIEVAISLLESELQFIPKKYLSAVDLIQGAALIPQFQHSDQYLLTTLAHLYVNVYVAFGGSEDYLNGAMLILSMASKMTSLSPFNKLVPAMLWAAYAEHHQHHSAMDAYDCCVQLLPQMASFGHSLSQRQENMLTRIRINETAHKAARYAISMQRFDKAIEYLEAARAILWSQILQFRSPFDALSSVSPGLGERLKEIAIELDHASHFNSTNAGSAIFDDKHTFRLSKLTAEWHTKLDEVRKLSGFEDYLLPPHLHSLQQAAYSSPIAVLIPHESGSHCLVMTSDTVFHIEMHSFTTVKLRRMATDIQGAAMSTSRVKESQGKTAEDHIFGGAVSSRFKSIRTFQKVTSPDDVFRMVLEELWTELVRPVIDMLHIKKSKNNRTTIQWCPTGVFTFLPVHAAGIYGSQHSGYSQQFAGECASDYIISSYTPTIGTLLHPENFSDAPKEFKMLAIVAAQDLFHTTQELENIKTRIPAGCLMEFGVNGLPAHVEAIVSQLPTASIVHFACHGIQDKSNPLHSGLLMEDGKLTIAKIMEHPRPGSLAFLCACETAMGDKNLPDEAMSVAASLLFSGFRSVIATMWRIMDVHGPTVTDTFYEELFRSSNGSPMSYPDFSKSALALDIAVQKLRSTGVPFNEWVPFIHMGKTN